MGWASRITGEPTPLAVQRLHARALPAVIVVISVIIPAIIIVIPVVIVVPVVPGITAVTVIIPAICRVACRC